MRDTAIASEKKTNKELQKLCDSLQEQIEYDKKGLDRFLKSIGKANILDDIAKYEKMSKLTDLAAQTAGAAGGSLAAEDRGANKLSSYSGVHRNLAELLALIQMRGGELAVETAGDALGGAQLKDADQEEVVAQIEDSIIKCFASLQTTTAKKVLDRCLKKATSVDKETQMGVDMFKYERQRYEGEILALKTELGVL